MKASAVLLASLSASLLLAGCATPEPGTVITSFDCDRAVPLGSIIPARRCTNEAQRTVEQQDTKDFIYQFRGNRSYPTPAGQ